ncbi:MAG: ABC transporter substrate-binding protein, partial [Nitrososphaerota archaeon]
NKLKIELWYTPTHYGDTEVDVAMLIKEAWEGTGIIEVELKSAEWTTYLDYTRKGLLGASLYGWYPDYIDPDDYTSPWVNTSWTGYAYSNPRLMDILREARTKPTIEERTRLYEQAQDIWAEDAAIVPLFQGKLTIATKEGIEGVILDPVMLFRYWLIYKT